MSRGSRPALFVVAIALLVVGTSSPLRAVGPALVMLHGGDLSAPVIVRTNYDTSFLWNPTNGGVQWGSRTRGTLPPSLEGRAYINVAIFWGRYDVATLKAADASQHGRFYPATGSAPAAIVVTAPHMAHTTDAAANPEPRPMPTSLDGFWAGWTTEVDVREWARRQPAVATR